MSSLALRLVALMVLCMSAFPNSGAADEWLGTYVGDKVPGYVILQSAAVGAAHSLTARGIGVPYPDFINIEMTCRQKGGKAIVNLRLGYVSVKDMAWQTSYGDCVFGVNKQP